MGSPALERRGEDHLKLAIYLMRLFVFYLGITPPKPEEEKRYAFLLLAILVAMTAAMVLLTWFILGSLFAANGMR